MLFEPEPAVLKGVAKEEQKMSTMLKPSDQKQAAGSPPPKPAGADPKNSPPQELETFYEEIPVNVTVIGTFQNIVYFFEKVAKLPRIVNISDISMGDRKEIKGKGYVINTSCTIKTYMFVDKFVDKNESVSEKVK